MKTTLLVILCAFALPVLAQDCRSILGPQSADTASLKKIEDRWDEAFMRGKAEYLDCLLSPDYVSVSPKAPMIATGNWSMREEIKTVQHRFLRSRA